MLNEILESCKSDICWYNNWCKNWYKNAAEMYEKMESVNTKNDYKTVSKK